MQDVVDWLRGTARAIRHGTHPMASPMVGLAERQAAEFNIDRALFSAFRGGQLGHSVFLAEVVGQYKRTFGDGPPYQFAEWILQRWVNPKVADFPYFSDHMFEQAKDGDALPLWWAKGFEAMATVIENERPFLGVTVEGREVIREGSTAIVKLTPTELKIFALFLNARDYGCTILDIIQQVFPDADSDSGARSHLGNLRTKLNDLRLGLTTDNSGRYVLSAT